MYDICGHRADGDVLNCANNTRAAPPSAELAATLQAACPTLWAEAGGMNGSYCCTPRQVEVLANNVRRAAGRSGGGFSRWRARSCACVPRDRVAPLRNTAQPGFCSASKEGAPPASPPAAACLNTLTHTLHILNTQTQRALPFIVSCPACQHNFVHLWCVLTCSADQATFTNVTEVQVAADNNATVVKEVDHWLQPAFSQALFDSCKVCVL